ncbi:hypothetical protein A8D95_03920 [Burkholderia cenocepacia]|uniref:Uncharacterized protein n=1 Tax=Burkholderia cenocepacia TaxID=95486 RepID=A0A1V2XLC4_9BURK|nr:hypothetical protein A8F32_36870 [Burkholderia cenocepacia]EPZ91184.1 hypothetical protein BURCENK562V_C0613 [Burkholderia cenocepacia K56-2Valvano]ERI31111.1 hypothetical protein BURCENBC7_AP4636 [Burkholderia cenocepacia BC7]ONJ05739.1 hypothetical protein A8F53_03625 [Burkholderia cenocepacia]ONJ08588.1 hypothetical protein A8F33_19350 [Burkholderia cenocepacia]
MRGNRCRCDARFGGCAAGPHRRARSPRGSTPSCAPPARAPSAVSRGTVDAARYPHTHLAFFAFCLVFLVTAFSQISA